MHKNLNFFKKNILVKIIEHIYEIIDLYQKYESWIFFIFIIIW